MQNACQYTFTRIFMCRLLKRLSVVQYSSNPCGKDSRSGSSGSAACGSGSKSGGASSTKCGSSNKSGSASSTVCGSSSKSSASSTTCSCSSKTESSSSSSTACSCSNKSESKSGSSNPCGSSTKSGSSSSSPCGGSSKSGSSSSPCGPTSSGSKDPPPCIPCPSFYDCRKFGHNLPCDSVAPHFETLPGIPTGIFRCTNGESLGRGADKCCLYPNPEYFSYHHMTFYDIHLCLRPCRMPSPISGRKK